MIFGSLYENYSNIDLEMVNEYKQQVGLISLSFASKVKFTVVSCAASNDVSLSCSP